MAGYPTLYIVSTIYMEIVEGCKIQGFCCKLAEHEILIFKKMQWLKQFIKSTKIPSPLKSSAYLEVNQKQHCK